jgi:hypothetical protein
VDEGPPADIIPTKQLQQLLGTALEREAGVPLWYSRMPDHTRFLLFMRPTAGKLPCSMLATAN